MDCYKIDLKNLLSHILKEWKQFNKKEKWYLDKKGAHVFLEHLKESGEGPKYLL